MKKSFRILSFILVTSTLALVLSGCGAKKEAPLNFITPIEGWADITLPEKSIFTRTNISGKVENHEYMTPLTNAELLAFVEKAMESQDWLLESSTKNARNFIKEGDHVQMTAKTETEEGTPLFIIIEPLNAYGPPPTDKTDEADSTTE